MYLSGIDQSVYKPNKNLQMQRSIKFALAAAIFSVQANAIAVERRGGNGGRGDRGDRGDRRERLSCEEATT